MSSTVSVLPSSDAAAQSRSTPLVLRWIVPSFADIVFIILLWILAFSPAGLQLFNDADTGWHIRTGEEILRTQSVPRIDLFSYTMAGRPWFAWEWLYDTLLAAVHHYAGLVGVRVLTAAVIAFTFALLYKLLLKRTDNVLVSVALAVLGAAAAQIHMLARPHVVTWLFTLLFLSVLYSFRGHQKRLLWLPPMMVVWVNSHGGFVVGLALIAIFLVAEVWQTACAQEQQERWQGLRNIRWLAAIAAACTFSTLLTPYGYGLHIHVVEYLRNRYIMDHNAEFQSPNFHILGAKIFGGLLLLVMATIALARRRLQPADVLLVLVGVYMALYASRNVPIAAILLTAAIAPSLAALVDETAAGVDVPTVIRRRFQQVQQMGTRMRSLQQELRGHIPAATALAFSCVVAWSGGRIAGHQAISASFSSERFPVQATEKIASLGIHQGVFSLDNWGGYLIYRLYPSFKVYGDDRHDFYGEQFVREFVDTAEAKPGWAKTLSKYKLDWVLMPPAAPISSALRQDPGWQIVYADNTAVLFQRK